MQQTVEKYVQQEQKQSIVNVYLKENQRHVFFSTANERHKTHKTVLKCVRSFSIYTLLLSLYHRIYLHKSKSGGDNCEGLMGNKRSVTKMGLCS
jgi:hypothetical protein